MRNDLKWYHCLAAAFVNRVFYFEFVVLIDSSLSARESAFTLCFTVIILRAFSFNLVRCCFRLVISEDQGETLNKMLADPDGNILVICMIH